MKGFWEVWWEHGTKYRSRAVPADLLGDPPDCPLSYGPLGIMSRNQSGGCHPEGWLVADHQDGPGGCRPSGGIEQRLSTRSRSEAVDGFKGQFQGFGGLSAA